jgi:aminopeptidase
MQDARLERLAGVLVDYSLGARPGDDVLISAPALAADLVRAVHARALAAGAHPLTRISTEGLAEALLAHGSTAQLEWISPIRLEEIEHVDCHLAILADWNTRSAAGVHPARSASLNRASQRIRARFLERAAAGELRWVLTAFPTNASAQEAEMSLPDYEDFFYAAAFLDDGDPVARWQSFAEDIERLARFLDARQELRIVADGTDLRLAVGGRRWTPSSGHENFPDGEVFTGPVETSVEGTIRFTYPAIFQRREVHDVRLRFEAGEVVESSAARGEDFLREMIALDEGARRVGEFAFGLNDAIDSFTRSLLLDEKIGGTIHLALGQSYPETGGRNDSALHWDLICDLRSGGEVYADGELVYRDGRFLPGLF